MGEDFSNKRVVIYDQGQFCDLATTIAKDWGRVDYYKPWKRSAPTSACAMVGNGMDNVNHVLNFWDVVPGADLIIVTDCYDGDLQTYLEAQGHRVWGTRRADTLEWDRELLKKTLKEVGLPVNPYKMVLGITKLREYLIEHDDVIVKLSLFRGDTETFDVPNYSLRKSKIDSLEYKYGPYSEKVWFLVEPRIETKIECGYDGYCVDDQFSDGFIDYETKNQSCLIAVKPYQDLPEEVRLVNSRLADVLKKHRYRGPLGTEIRIDEQGRPHCIDLTCRNASPPGETLWAMTSNLSQFMYYGAEGIMVPIEWAGKYACQIMLTLDWEDRAWSEVFIPDKVKPFVKLGTYSKVDGLYYPIANEGYEPLPWGREMIGNAIGISDGLEDAIKKAKANADAVQGFKVSYNVAAIAEGIESIIAGEKEGIEFSDGQIPEPGVVLETAD